MVSNSRNKIHQTWPKPFSGALYFLLRTCWYGDKFVSRDCLSGYALTVPGRIILCPPPPSPTRPRASNAAVTMNVTKGPRERDGEAWRRVAELQRSSWQLHTVAVASPSSISLHLLPAPRPHSRLRTGRNTLDSRSTYWALANGSHMVW